MDLIIIRAKLDPVLDDPSNELYPDMMGLEVDYVQKYVNSDWVQNVADLGITADDYANSYQYNLDLGSDVDGNVRALFWQATPGCYAVRADLAEKYLGTTDPAALAEKFKDLDTIVATAKEVNDASGGKCKLFSGYDEIKRSLTGSRTQASMMRTIRLQLMTTSRHIWKQLRLFMMKTLPSIPISGALTGVQT